MSKYYSEDYFICSFLVSVKPMKKMYFVKNNFKVFKVFFNLSRSVNDKFSSMLMNLIITLFDVVLIYYFLFFYILYMYLYNFIIDLG